MPFKNPHPLYSTWQSMRRRCLTPSAKQWSDYGGRGIKICPEWDSFSQFASDMGPRPSSSHSLDRRDNDGDYEPSNCRWATRKEQQRNRRISRWVDISGGRYLAAELAETYGLKVDTIITRAEAGLTFDLVVSKKKVLNFHSWRSAVAVRVFNQRTATHCKRGHEWTAENTRVTKEGWKACRQCHAAKMRRRNAEKRASNK